MHYDLLWMNDDNDDDAVWWQHQPTNGKRYCEIDEDVDDGGDAYDNDDDVGK